MAIFIILGKIFCNFIFENISINFIQEIKVPEIRAYYDWQAAMETIHSETYALMIDTYISDYSEKIKILNGIKELPGVKKKAEWTKKWLDKDIPFQERLVAFTIVEGIFFAGSDTQFGRCINNKIHDITQGAGTQRSFGIRMDCSRASVVANNIQAISNTTTTAQAIGISVAAGTENLILSNYAFNNGSASGIANLWSCHYLDSGTNTKADGNCWQL